MEPNHYVILQHGTARVSYKDVPALIAGALHPDRKGDTLAVRVLRVDAEERHRKELRHAADMGAVALVDHAGLPTTPGEHAFIRVPDLRTHLARFDIGLLLPHPGSGARLSLRGKAADAVDDAAAPPRWGAWLQLPNVKLWQAVALSINREPTEPLLKAIFEKRHAADNGRVPAQVAELLERWHYCEQALESGRIRPQGYGIANPPVCPVHLSEVTDFLARAGFELPEELRALGPAPAEPTPTIPAPALEATGTKTKASAAAQKEAREDARLAHCEANGIVFDKHALLRLPDGIGEAAQSLDPPIRRQSLSTDVKAALSRRFERARNGKG